MNRSFTVVVIAFFSALFIFSGPCVAQAPPPPFDPKVCESLQAQIDQIVAIGNSPLPEEEKVAKLTDSWKQSWAEIQKLAAGDPETAERIKSLADLMTLILHRASPPTPGTEKGEPAEIKDLLAKITMKDLAKPILVYTLVARSLCPKLKLPPFMGTD